MRTGYSDPDVRTGLRDNQASNGVQAVQSSRSGESRGRMEPGCTRLQLQALVEPETGDLMTTIGTVCPYRKLEKLPIPMAQAHKALAIP